MPRLASFTAQIRASKIVKDLQEADGNMAEVARKQGRSRQAVRQQVMKPYVQQRTADFLEKAGVTDVLLAKKIKEGLNAKVTKLFTRERPTQDSRIIIDFPPRHKYIETALKLKGHLNGRNNDNPSTTWVQILEGIEISDLEKMSFAERINTLESRLKNQGSQLGRHIRKNV